MESKATRKSDEKAKEIIMGDKILACANCGVPMKPGGQCEHNEYNITPQEMDIERALELAGTTLNNAEKEFENRQNIMDRLKSMYGHISYDRKKIKGNENSKEMIIDDAIMACPDCGNPKPNMGYSSDSPMGSCKHGDFHMDARTMDIEHALDLGSVFLTIAGKELKNRQDIMNKLKDMYGHIIYDRSTYSGSHQG